jgi:5-methylcytosine-specific restriction endonuclease McrA
MKNAKYSFYNWFKSNFLGYCLICNNYGKLTFDHIFPVSCGNSKIILYDFLHRKLKMPSNKGFALRTICVNCNNKLLGPLDQKLAIKGIWVGQIG